MKDVNKIALETTSAQSNRGLRRTKIGSVIRTGIGVVVVAALGAAAGIALWAVSVLVLLAAGLSFYSVSTAFPVALGVALLAAVLLYRRHRHGLAAARQQLAFAAGAVGMLLYLTIGTIIAEPHTILFL